MIKIHALKSSSVRYTDKKSLLRASSIPLWRVPLSCGIVASVKLINSNTSVEASINDYEITEGLFSSLNTHPSEKFDSFSDSEKNEMCRLTKILDEASDKVLDLIKYNLNHQEISEELTRGGKIKWSEDGAKWKLLPQGVDVITQSICRSRLDPETINYIQKSLDEDITPLIAMRHLHRAKKEVLPHHKWIDATIAAELAVKEVLIKANPDLKTILLDLPSPPLTKLYGHILEEYLGERSPFLSTIRNGVEVRNRLVHKPSEEKIHIKDAFDYVDTIEEAIFHLLGLIYPKNMLIQYTSIKLL